MTAIEMKAEIACYWRFKRSLTLVAVEAEHQDVISVSDKRLLLYTEIKCSLGDLRNDIFKPIHHRIRAKLGALAFVVPDDSKLSAKSRENLMKLSKWGQFTSIYECPSRFYFATPAGLTEKASTIVKEMYPYAGLLSVQSSTGDFLGHRVQVEIEADTIHETRVSPLRCLELVKAQSASLANAYSKIAKLKRKT